jgi:hypothetical protein
MFVHPSTLSSHICSGNVHLLRLGGGGGGDLPRILVMSSSRLAARTAPFLPVKTIDPPEGINYMKLSFSIVNSALIDVSITHNLFHGTSGANSADYMALVASC